MLNNLSYTTKNRLLLAGAVLLALLSWNMAFKKTAEAIILNKDLNHKSEIKSDLAMNPEYLKRKQEVLSRSLKQYTLDSAEWKDGFWLKTSRIAAVKNIHVIYHPGTADLSADSASVVSRQSISFEGDYKNLVVVLDSVQKSEGTGFITSAVFRKENDRQQLGPGKLRLNLVFSIVKKN